MFVLRIRKHNFLILSLSIIISMVVIILAVFWFTDYGSRFTILEPQIINILTAQGQQNLPWEFETTQIATSHFIIDVNRLAVSRDDTIHISAYFADRNEGTALRHFICRDSKCNNIGTTLGVITGSRISPIEHELLIDKTGKPLIPYSIFNRNTLTPELRMTVCNDEICHSKEDNLIFSEPNIDLDGAIITGEDLPFLLYHSVATPLGGGALSGNKLQNI